MKFIHALSKVKSKFCPGPGRQWARGARGYGATVLHTFERAKFQIYSS